MQKETKNLKTSIQDVSEKGLVTIQITQFDQFDNDNDRFVKGAFTKTWNESSQVHLVDHKMGMQTFVGLPVSKDPNSGIIVSQLNLKKQVARDLLEDYKFGQEHGRSMQHSHGFKPVQGKFSRNEKGGRDLFEVKQFEYSTLLFGAVSDTPLHGIKSDSDAKELIHELEMKLSSLNYSDEYGKLLEAKVRELKSMILEPEIHSIETKEPSKNTQLKELLTYIKI